MKKAHVRPIMSLAKFEARAIIGICYSSALAIYVNLQPSAFPGKYKRSRGRNVARLWLYYQEEHANISKSKYYLYPHEHCYCDLMYFVYYYTYLGYEIK